MVRLELSLLGEVSIRIVFDICPVAEMRCTVLFTVTVLFLQSMSDHFNAHSSPRRIPVNRHSRIAALAPAEVTQSAALPSPQAVSFTSTPASWSPVLVLAALPQALVLKTSESPMTARSLDCSSLDSIWGCFGVCFISGSFRAGIHTEYFSPANARICLAVQQILLRMLSESSLFDK